MIGREFAGEIDKFVDRGPKDSFGFIQFTNGGRRVERIFFSLADVRPTNIGTIEYPCVVGNLVRFKTGRVMHRGQPSLKS